MKVRTGQGSSPRGGNVEQDFLNKNKIGILGKLGRVL
jgi:hypothetical protein